jgi:DNA helicase HerA-like ATPase
MGIKEKIKTVQQLDTVQQLHELRSNLEDAFAKQPAQAYSIDGKTFSYETSLRNPFQTGDFLVLTTIQNKKYIGQVLYQNVAEMEGPEYGVSMDTEARVFLTKGPTSANFKNRLKIPILKGSGNILGRWEGNSFECTSNSDSFQGAQISHAPGDMVREYLSYQAEDTIGIEIGKAVHSQPEARVYLRSDGFNRHTFLCGQSGSGKTFGLSVILERLLLHTSLPIIILDPNSDFIHLDEMHDLTEVNASRSIPLSPEKYDEYVKKYSTQKSRIRILRSKEIISSTTNPSKTWYPLCMNFSDLHWSDQAASLRLDPLHDRDEYQRFQTTVKNFGRDDFSLRDIREIVQKDFSESARHVGLRIENLGIGEWDVWNADKNNTLAKHLSDNLRLLVIDIGSLSSPDEKLAVTLSTLGYLWRARQLRQPILLVADEAHNLCPQIPASPIDKVAVDHFIRVAGEGRKFGIYMLLASQRPGKIHQNILTQCENLILMKMNSRADLNRIAELFSQIPLALLEEASKFNLGQGLVNGRVIRTPTIVKFDGKLLKEGGADIPTTWAAPNN